MAAKIGERVRDARANAKLSLRALAERVPELDYTAISRIETGERRVASHELYALAEALGTTTADLLGEPGRTSALSVAARLGSAAHPDYLRQAIDRVTQVLEMDDLITRVAGGPSPVSRPTIRVPRGGSAVGQGRALALATRDALGLGSGPVGDLPSMLEERFGAHVIAQPIAGEVHGLCVTDGRVSVVVVNTRDRWTRQRFTLAHELAHLLVGDLELFEVTWQAERDDTTERRADSFAAHFLAPDDGIKQAIGDRRVDASVVAELMDYFGVSFESMCWRLINLRLLTQQAASAMASGGVRAVITAADLTSNFDQRAALSERVTTPPARLARRAIDAYARGDVGVGVVAAVLGDADLGAVRRLLQEAGITPADAEAPPASAFV